MQLITWGNPAIAYNFAVLAAVSPAASRHTYSHRRLAKAADTADYSAGYGFVNAKRQQLQLALCLLHKILMPPSSEKDTSFVNNYKQS